MDVIERFRKRRMERKKAREDANNRLPFGLCEREGIEIGDDWGPSEAWAALAEKGITPDGEYSKMKKEETRKNPNDDVPRAHTAKSLSGFDKHRQEKAKKSILNDLDDAEKQEVADMLTEMFDKGAYRIARGPDSFGGIIENGYKSQIETGTSGENAALNKEWRKTASDKMYGHGGLDDTEYEKYGYLGFADDDMDADDELRPEYGDVTYTLKKDRMQDRVTYSFGDSLNAMNYISTPGYAGDKPTIEGMTSLGNPKYIRRALKEYERYKKGEQSYEDMFRRAKEWADNMYVELQYHGPVTFEDIDTITFNTMDSMIGAFRSIPNSVRERIIKKLKNSGVKVKYRQKPGAKFEDAMPWIEDFFG